MPHLATSMPSMRRHERQRDLATGLDLLGQGEWGQLALVSPDGAPYSVPLSYALAYAAEHASGTEATDALPSVIFHMAREGRKLDCLAHETRGAFTVVGATEVLPGDFSTRYLSVMAFGRLHEVTDEAEKVRLLLVLAAKYSPGFETEATSYARTAVGKTRVWLLHTERISVKGRR